MRAAVTRIRNDDGGQDAAEYGIAMAVIGLVAVSAALMIGSKVGAIWNPVDSVISAVHGKSHGDHGNGHGKGHS